MDNYELVKIQRYRNGETDSLCGKPVYTGGLTQEKSQQPNNAWLMLDDDDATWQSVIGTESLQHGNMFI